MLEEKSRYYDLETAVLKTEEGGEISYKKRRFLPQGEKAGNQAQIVVQEEDRLDLIAWKKLGDPELFWQICDANNAMNPFDLMKPVGRKLSLPTSEGIIPL